MKPWRVAVIGGGVTGLAAAHALSQHDTRPEVTLFEASSRAGGVIETLAIDPLLIELGPDMFTTRDPDALQLCKELGIADELIGTETKRRGALIVKRGRLHRVPEGMALMAPQQLSSVMKTPLLSWRGRLRLVAESCVPARKGTDDESLESFACRRFGREAYEWLIQPLISGIYTADPQKLSMQATMDEFLQMERSAGSVIRATLRKQRAQRKSPATVGADMAGSTGARYGLFLAPRAGMERIVQSLVHAIGSHQIRLNCPVSRLDQDPATHDWTVHFQDGQLAERYDAVVLATRASVAGKLLRDRAPELSSELRAIPYASTAVAVLVVDRDQVSQSVETFGMVVPLAEHREIIAASFSNHKFTGRAPNGKLIMRVFIGGACQPQLLQRSDRELIELATRELVDLIGLNPKVRFDFEQVVRWNEAMPQYHIGHCDRIARIEDLARSLNRLELAGNAYHGVGIPACIASGRQAAMATIQSVRTPSTKS